MIVKLNINFEEGKLRTQVRDKQECQVDIETVDGNKTTPGGKKTVPRSAYCSFHRFVKHKEIV